MEFKGKVIKRLDVKSGTSSKGDWKSVEYVIEETEGQYPKKMVFRVFGEERVNNALANLHKGAEAIVSFDINANEYQGRWFNSINAWKIIVDGMNVLTGEEAQAPQAAPEPKNDAPTNIPATDSGKGKDAFADGNGSDGGDDLPF